MRQDQKEHTLRIYPGVMRDIARPWEDALHLGRRTCFRKGAVIFPDEDDRLKMFYVREGKIAVSYLGPNGESHISLFFESGSFFNEQVAISGASRQFEPAVCLEDAECFLFDVALLSDREFRERYDYLIDNLLLCIALKLVNFHALLNVICTKKALPLVAWYILNMYEFNDRRLTFKAGITQREVAALVGIDISSVTRAIRTLKERDIIQTFTKKNITILDIASLQRIAES